MFRHYWVLAKLLITIFASGLLLLHMQVASRMAGEAARTTPLGAELGGPRLQLVADAGAALLILLVATTLSVYKPKGLTTYGQRKQSESSDSIDDTRNGAGVVSARDATPDLPRRVSLSMLIVMSLLVLFAVRHLTGGGLGGHIR